MKTKEQASKKTQNRDRTVSLSPETHKRLSHIAIERDTTNKAIVTEWVNRAEKGEI